MISIALLIILYLICAALLWLVGFVIGQDGARTSFGAAVGATVLMGISGIASDYFLGPHVGDYRLLVELFVDILIIKLVLRLTILRALLTGILFWVLLTALVFFYM